MSIFYEIELFKSLKTKNHIANFSHSFSWQPTSQWDNVKFVIESTKGLSNGEKIIIK